MLVVLGLLLAGGGAYILVSSGEDDGDDESTVATNQPATTVSPTTLAEPTTTTVGGEIDAFDLAEGDCWNEPPDVTELASATIVACDIPHDLEVYAVYDVAFSDFPGEEEIGTTVENECIARFATFVGVDYLNSTLDVLSLYPTQDSWDLGDREATCSLSDPATQTTGTLQGAAR